MAKYALIHSTDPVMEDGTQRVCDIAENEAGRFEVHTDFQWVQCPDQVKNRDWKYKPADGSWVAPSIPPTEYGIARRVHYGEVGAQLDRIFHATMAGATDPLGEWAAEQEKIKIVFPKDNPDFCNASNEEIVKRCAAILEAEEAATGVYGKYIDMREMALQLYQDMQDGTWTNPHA